MRILHAADLHIDSPLGGLSAYEGAPVEEIRGATRRATENLIETAIAREVDVVVVAGDVFDGDWRDYSTGLFWVGQLARLNDAGIPVVLITGNHDAASIVSQHLTLPPNIALLSNAHPEVFVIDDLDLAVVGQGYATRVVTEDLAAGYPAADPGLFTLGLLHTSLDGRPGHDAYAPTTTAILRSKGYGYWGLGHVHQREVIATDPWIVFPGNLQGRHARETGPKGATLVTVEGRQVTEVEAIALDVVRFGTCEIDASRLHHRDDVIAALADRFAQTCIDAGARLSVARVIVSGASPAHEDLWRDPHGFDADVRSAGQQSGRLWVEKVKLATRSANRDRFRDDEAITAIGARIEELRADPAGLAGVAEDLEALRAKLAADARSGDHAAVDTLRIGTPEHLAECLDASRELIVTLLADGAA
jgi:DNA repair exonuclease SbcCD nuclease subunit